MGARRLKAARKPGWRRAAVAAGVAVLLLLTYAAARLAPLLFDPAPPAGTISIERSAAYRDPALMRLAWHQPVAMRYAALPFEFQHNQSFCGPASAAEVLHSLRDRRSQDRVLAGAAYHTVLGYLPGGLTLEQEADVLHRASGRPVSVLRGLTLDRFRAEMRAVNDPHRRYVANFSRGPLFGRGHGHFSPLLAYLPGRDLVLVGDVNANYRPFLVATARLWRAVATVDPATGRQRGLIALTVE